MQFHIENMTCFGCARNVTRAINSIDAAAQVKADPENRTITVASSATREALEEALATAGYPATRSAA
jgi:copper chaperone